MTAREKFQRGDRVRIPDAVIRQRGFRSGRCGTVTGYGRRDTYVRVRLDGRKDSITYHMDHWEQIPRESREFTVRICDQCYRLEGEMCHNPECVFCRRTMAEVGEALDMLCIRPVVDGERLDLWPFGEAGASTKEQE